MISFSVNAYPIPMYFNPQAFSWLLSIVGLLLTTIGTAAAQTQAKSKVTTLSQGYLSSDSTKVYTFVQKMPVYPGEGGMKALTATFLRDFQVASAEAGCSPPAPVFVTFVVGPSGLVYDVASVNNLPFITKDEAKAGKRGIVGDRRPLPEMSADCEAALVAAGRKLPRFKPGMQNGRRVAVNYTLKLIEAK
jgi:hypothetical protein